ncbi:16S rRNA (uracil(1498)-N(3))-methyltransferase [Candidatus Poribacteria bacterium]|nr:MAG: 16S rRNA (uracil(1498)-N(3))-methyltransferase [Candidatus Poribacteria bacterium]
MHTFYIPSIQINKKIATVKGSEQHHLRNVLRLGHGDTIRIVDGKGSVCIGEIYKIDAESTEAEILSHEFHQRDTPSLTLFQGLPKYDKMELILEKTTELGVSQIAPMSTERSLQEPSENRCERWHRVVLSATKQCKRAWLPELCEMQQFENCLNTLQKYAISLIFWENEKEQHLKAVLRKAPEVESIAFLVGPEGGFTDKEVDAAIENGCIPVTIGSNILRTETAAIAGITIAAYEYQI